MSILPKTKLAIIGTLVSVGISILFLVNGQDIAWSVAVGLLGTILITLFEIVHEQRHGLNEVLMALGFEREAVKNSLVHDVIQTTIRCSVALRSRFPGVQGFLTPQLEQAVAIYIERVTELSRGHVQLPTSRRENFRFAARLVQSAKEYGKAVAYGNVREQWEGRDSVEYQQANWDAAKRGVKITRIFILQGAQMSSSKEMILEQIAAGIDAYVVEESQVEPELLDDFAIWDGRYLGRSEARAGGKVVGGYVSVDSVEIREAEAKFDRLLTRSFPASSYFSDLAANARITKR